MQYCIANSNNIIIAYNLLFAIGYTYYYVSLNKKIKGCMIIYLHFKDYNII